MNRGLLTSAVAIHATACVVAFLAVGPGQAGASASRLGDTDAMTAIDEIVPAETVEWAHAVPAVEVGPENFPESYGLENAEPLQDAAVVGAPSPAGSRVRH